MILGLTFALLNHRMATAGPDPLGWNGIIVVWAVSIILSIGAELILARCYVVVGSAELEVRNPTRRYRVLLSSIGEMKEVFSDFRFWKSEIDGCMSSDWRNQRKWC